MAAQDSFKYPSKSNGQTFQPLENRVAPMIIKLAETLERQAVMKIAKQIRKSSAAAADRNKR